MKPENRILELLKENPMLMTELQKELGVTTNGIVGVMAFLEQYKLVETLVSTEHELMAKITPDGLQLLNLPDLPEDETPSNLLEVMERHWGGEAGQGCLLVIRKSDAIHTTRSIAKDNVLAKLVQDIKEKRR